MGNGSFNEAEACLNDVSQDFLVMAIWKKVFSSFVADEGDVLKASCISGGMWVREEEEEWEEKIEKMREGVVEANGRLSQQGTLWYEDHFELKAIRT